MIFYDYSIVSDMMLQGNAPNIDSNLILPEDIDFVYSELVSGKNLNLIYRGSVHGYKSSDFHTKCDNIVDTLVVIKSEHGKIFGGKTS